MAAETDRRYEVRLADERVCDPADVNGVFDGFDCWSVASSAARARSRVKDLAYRVWDVEQEHFVYPQNGDDVVVKDAPSVENPLAPSGEEKEAIRREEQARAAAHERR